VTSNADLLLRHINFLYARLQNLTTFLCVLLTYRRENVTKYCEHTNKIFVHGMAMMQRLDMA
jgi:hypothetical protein